MASVYDLKPRFQALLRRPMRAMAQAGVTPNVVTVAALAGSVAVGAALPFGRTRPAWLALLPVWLAVRMALNALDGMMARELGMASRRGAVLNEMGDVLGDLALYLPLALVDPRALWPAVAFAISAL